MVGPHVRKLFLDLRTPGEAKKLGRRINLRPDWETAKDQVMEKLLRQKFQIPELRRLLTNTGTARLEEGNTWGDTYWGTVNGVGQNKLGLTLMRIRDEILRQGHP